MGRKYETRRAWVKMTHSTPNKGRAIDPKELIGCTHWSPNPNVKCIYKSCQPTCFMINVILRKDQHCYKWNWEKRPRARVDFVCVCVSQCASVCSCILMWFCVSESTFKVRWCKAVAALCVLPWAVVSKTLQKGEGYTDMQGENTSMKLIHQASCGLIHDINCKKEGDNVRMWTSYSSTCRGQHGDVH